MQLSLDLNEKKKGAIEALKQITLIDSIGNKALNAICKILNKSPYIVNNVIYLSDNKNNNKNAYTSVGLVFDFFEPDQDIKWHNNEKSWWLTGKNLNIEVNSQYLMIHQGDIKHKDKICDAISEGIVQYEKSQKILKEQKNIVYDCNTMTWIGNTYVQKPNIPILDSFSVIAKTPLNLSRSFQDMQI